MKNCYIENKTIVHQCKALSWISGIHCLPVSRGLFTTHHTACFLGEGWLHFTAATVFSGWFTMSAFPKFYGLHCNWIAPSRITSCLALIQKSGVIFYFSLWFSQSSALYWNWSYTFSSNIYWSFHIGTALFALHDLFMVWNKYCLGGFYLLLSLPAIMKSTLSPFFTAASDCWHWRNILEFHLKDSFHF